MGRPKPKRSARSSFVCGSHAQLEQFTPVLGQQVHLRSPQSIMVAGPLGRYRHPGTAPGAAYALAGIDFEDFLRGGLISRSSDTRTVGYPLSITRNAVCGLWLEAVIYDPRLIQWIADRESSGLGFAIGCSIDKREGNTITRSTLLAVAVTAEYDLAAPARVFQRVRPDAREPIPPSETEPETEPETETEPMIEIGEFKASGQDYPILTFFKYAHLPSRFQEVSKQFARLAVQMASTLPSCAETSAGLRKLLEAKDCAVRASI